MTLIPPLLKSPKTNKYHKIALQDWNCQAGRNMFRASHQPTLFFLCRAFWRSRLNFASEIIWSCYARLNISSEIVFLQDSDFSSIVLPLFSTVFWTLWASRAERPCSWLARWERRACSRGKENQRAKAFLLVDKVWVFCIHFSFSAYSSLRCLLHTFPR